MVGDGNVCGDWGVLALLLDFREVMLTSPPELAQCAPLGMSMLTDSTFFLKASLIPVLASLFSKQPYELLID